MKEICLEETKQPQTHVLSRTFALRQRSNNRRVSIYRKRRLLRRCTCGHLKIVCTVPFGISLKYRPAVSSSTAYFPINLWCAVCRRGFGKQGYQCQGKYYISDSTFFDCTGHVVPLLIFHSCVSACQTAVHKKCHDKLLTKCPESGRESENTIVSAFALHNLATYKRQIFFKIYENNRYSFVHFLWWESVVFFLVKVQCISRGNYVCLFA